MSRFPLRAADALGRRGRVLRARRAARRAGAIVLLYHRVAAPEDDPWKLAVAPQTFDRQLELLGARFRVMPLSELAAAARAGRVPERALAISFDDGYLDNLEAALPLLESHGAPATLYVASGYVGREVYWWDELRELLSGRGERPSRLELDVGGCRVAVATATAAERRRVLTEVLHPLLRHGGAEAVERALEALREWAGPVELPSEQLGRPMTRPELERIAASELIELGAHSVRHLSLPSLPRAAQRAEVAASRDFVAELVGRPPASFSFPFGDNDPVSRWTVRKCGFEYAVGVGEPMPLTAAARRFELPRLVAEEEPPEALARRIEAALAFTRLP
jgi:peptidoglycan/xylan/chitin deacetylase (PgdA/CDA1 family)